MNIYKKKSHAFTQGKGQTQKKRLKKKKRQKGHRNNKRFCVNYRKKIA